MQTVIGSDIAQQLEEARARIQDIGVGEACGWPAWGLKEEAQLQLEDAQLRAQYLNDVFNQVMADCLPFVEIEQSQPARLRTGEVLEIFTRTGKVTPEKLWNRQPRGGASLQRLNAWIADLVQHGLLAAEKAPRNLQYPRHPILLEKEAARAREEREFLAARDSVHNLVKTYSAGGKFRPGRAFSDALAVWNTKGGYSHDAAGLSKYVQELASKGLLPLEYKLPPRVASFIAGLLGRRVESVRV